MHERRKDGQRQRRFLQSALGALISLACLWWVLRSVNQEEIIGQLKRVSIAPLVGALVCTAFSYLLRSYRWIFFFGAKQPGFADSFRCLIVGFFMNNVLPARMGELVRAHLGGRATNQSRSVVLATIAGERLADGLMISLLFALLFPFGHTTTREAAELYFVAYLFLVASVGTAVVLWKRRRIFTILERLGRIMPGHLSTYTLVRLKRFIQGLEPLLHLRRVAWLLILSAAVWLVELFAYGQVAAAFGQPLSIGDLSLFLAAVNFSSLIPAAPGGIGVIEAFATLALTRIGVAHETGLAMVASQHLIQYLVVGIPGAFFFFFRLRGKLPDSSEDPDLESEDEKEALGQRFADVSEPRPNDEPASVPTFDVDEPESEIALSIVIPAYNEELRLPRTLVDTIEYLTRREISAEILVVDDGSSDRTSEVVQKFERLSPMVTLLTYPQNRGKGYAVRFGVLNARGRLVLYNDADGATPIEEVERLEEAIAAGADVAIGSRAMFSLETNVDTVWYRKLIGRVFNGLVNVILLPGIADTQCGFKMFVRPAARSLFSQQRSERFSFDVEILFLARKAGFRISEVPINWHNVPGSKVNLARDSAAMFFDLVRFRLRDVFGGYSGLVKAKEALRSS